MKKVASFELGKEIEKDVFPSCHERMEEWNLRPLDSTETIRPKPITKFINDTRSAYF